MNHDSQHDVRRDGPAPSDEAMSENVAACEKAADVSESRTTTHDAAPSNSACLGAACLNAACLQTACLEPTRDDELDRGEGTGGEDDNHDDTNGIHLGGVEINGDVSFGVVNVEGDASSDGALSGALRPYSFCEIAVVTWRIQVSMFLGLFTFGISQGFLPALQDDAFGGNVFLATGILAAVLGITSAIAGPALGALSDILGRGTVLGLAVGLGLVPSIFMVVNTKWTVAYLTTTSVFGIIQSASGVIFSATADCLAAQPRPCAEAIAMSLPVLTMLVGMTAGSFAGGAVQSFVGYRGAFIFQLVLGALTVAFNVFMFPKGPRVTEFDTTAAQENSATIPSGTGSFGEADMAENAPMVSGRRSRTDTVELAPDTTPGLNNAATEAAVPLLTHDDRVGVYGGDRDGSHGASIATGGSSSKSNKSEKSDDMDLDLDLDLIDPLDFAARVRSMWRVTAHVLRTQPATRVLLPACFLNNIAEQSLFNLIGIYFKERFDFTTMDQNFVLLGVTLGSVFSLLVFVPVATKRIGTVITTRVSMLSNVVVMLLLACVWKAWQVPLIFLPTALSMAVFPAVAALAAEETAMSGNLAHLGFVLGSIAAARNAAAGVGPAALGAVLRQAQGGQWPGWPFLLCAASAVVASGLLFLIDRRRYH